MPAYRSPAKEAVSAPVVVMAEPLERRRLLASFAVLVGGTLTVTGTAGNDTIFVNSSGGNIVATLNGAVMTVPATQVQLVQVLGGQGADRLTTGNGLTVEAWGGPGADTVLTGDGNDTVFAGKGSDSVNAGDGINIVEGETGNDSLTAGSGDNELLGGMGDDSIVGNSGNDTIFGGQGNDSLFGAAGNDLIVGGLGNDSMFGGDGNDTLLARDGFVDNVAGGPGTNAAQIDAGVDLVTGVQIFLP